MHDILAAARTHDRPGTNCRRSLIRSIDMYVSGCGSSSRAN